MATFYSSFFSSGLQVNNQGGSPAPPSPSTPRPAQTDLPDDSFQLEHETTPTGPAFSPPSDPSSSVLPSITLNNATTSTSSATHDDSRPRLRRRRSSLTIGTSPLAALKTSNPLRSATTSQRQTLLRARSGSDASVISMSSTGPSPDAPSPPTGIIGRLRSGSVGTALRSRRVLRKNAPPPPPPPTSPLPPPPFIVIPPTPTFAQTPSTPRRPLAKRAQTDNFLLSSSPNAGDEDSFGFALGSSPGYARGGGEYLGKRAMQIDYPSPIEPDSAIFWAGGRDADMKEN